MNFDTWYKLVDALCIERLELGIDDLPDWTSRDYFDEGLTPKEALAARFDVDSVDEITPEIAMDFI